MKKIILTIFCLLCTLRAPAYRDGFAVVGLIKGANMNTTADQMIEMSCSRYIIRRIMAVNPSTSLTLAVGGIYTATSKGGSAVVANTQVYTVLTGATKYLDITLASVVGTDIRTEAALYLSLTTGQGGAATCDIYIMGDCVD